MTLITFFALSSIQKDAGMNDTRYARDLGLLLSGNVTELVANRNIEKNLSKHSKHITFGKISVLVWL